jgi:ribosomal protein S18 acetylase RimI-like enzyme
VRMSCTSTVAKAPATTHTRTGPHDHPPNRIRPTARATSLTCPRPRTVLAGAILQKMIRRGVLADLRVVREVYRSASLSNAGDRANLLAHPEHLILGPEGLNEGRTLVAEEDGSVVGFATWTDVDGVVELEDLFVDPDWTRRGIATALVKGIAEVVRARGVERLEVTANPHAMGFYTGIGFIRCGVARTEFGQAPHGAGDSSVDSAE